MDVSDGGKLFKLAGSLGKVVGTSPLDEDLERLALALHVERAGASPIVVAGSANHDDVLALYPETETAIAAMAAARVLIHERAFDLRPGVVLTLVAGAAGSRSVRGGTGAFAIVDAKALGLPTWITAFAVSAPPPVCNWEKATLDEVKSVVPDLVSRFPRPRKAKDGPMKPASSGPRTIIRRR